MRGIEDGTEMALNGESLLSTVGIGITMLQNHLKIALRSMRKQKVYSTIMIGGFSMGIAACLLIALFIRDELSYDKHIPDAEQIYRVYAGHNFPGRDFYEDVFFPAPLARTLEQDYPEVERAGHINPHKLFGAGNNYVRSADAGENSENYFENGFVWADQGIVDVLQIPIMEGDAAHVLDKPGTILISQRIAEKLFGKTSVLGKVVILNNDSNRRYIVSGVMKDFPTRGHLKYQFLMSLVGDPFYPEEQSRWVCDNYYTYVKLRPGTDVGLFEKKLSGIATKYYAPSYEAGGYFVGQDFRKMLTFGLQPVRGIHLKSFDLQDGLNHGDIRFVWMFGIIGCFILLIACVNFVNLSTARSANRAREVGMRKVVGSDRAELIRQFLVESMLFSFISFALGVVITELALPYFGGLTGKALSFPWAEWSVWPILVASVIMVGLLAGVFPAFYLSSFRPIQVLKGDVSRGARSGGLRNGLVIFQFSTCILLIIGTIVVYRQLDYILNTKLGYEKDQVILIKGTNILGDQLQGFKDEVKRLSGVESASIGDYLPIDEGARNRDGIYLGGSTWEASGFTAQRWQVDTDYVHTLGMNIVSGRDFSPEISSDSGAAIINQRMASELGLADPIGKQITNSYYTWTIVGVVEDFHFESLRQTIAPLFLLLGNSPTMMAVRIKGGDLNNTIDSITGVWGRFFPGQPIRYSFLDESYARMYADVESMGRLLTYFSLLAILVACLGLYALSAFLTEQRNKEISIRRVVGASLSSIFGLLTAGYVKLVIVAFGIAAPFGWYLMQRWLDSFAYRIEMTWDVFLLAGFIAMLIAVATVSYQSLKAGQTDPAKGLRTE